MIGLLNKEYFRAVVNVGLFSALPITVHCIF